MTKPRHFETDADIYELVRWCQENTPLRQLNSIDARAVFVALFRLGYRLCEPDRHPSGVKTTERAIVKLEPLPAAILGLGGAQKVEG